MQHHSEQLQSLIKELDGSSIDYRIVGGVARIAYTGEKADNLKDVDLLISQEGMNVPAQKVALHTIWSKFNAEGLRIDTYPSECVSLDKDKIRVKVLGQQFDLSPLLFAPVKKSIGSVDITTVDPLTLFHLFSGFGVVRQKDWKHMFDLGRCIKQNKLSTLTEKDFQTWHYNLRRIYGENHTTLLFLQGKRNFKNLLPDSTIELLRPITEGPLKCLYDTVRKIDEYIKTHK